LQLEKAIENERRCREKGAKKRKERDFGEFVKRIARMSTYPRTTLNYDDDDVFQHYSDDYEDYDAHED
jgi:hypothetical protein